MRSGPLGDVRPLQQPEGPSCFPGPAWLLSKAASLSAVLLHQPRTEDLGLGGARTCRFIPSLPSVCCCSDGCTKEEIWGCGPRISPGVSSLTAHLPPDAAGTIHSSQSRQPPHNPPRKGLWDLLFNSEN